MTKIIAFAGRKQSGKTTCAEAVYQAFCADLLDTSAAKIYNFADPLKKDICMNILGLTYDQCYGSDIDKNTTTHLVWEGNNLTAREVMQIVGTDIFRKMYTNVWADSTINKIKTEKKQLAIIADCRFPNEVEAVRKSGGLVIKLTRNLHDSDHASEVALDENNYDQQNFDLIVPNHKLSIREQTNAVIHFLAYKGILPS